MKYLTLFILFFSFLLSGKAQSDSLAIKEIKELGIYYFNGNDICQIAPITYSGIKAGGFMKIKAKMMYDGENSSNVISRQIFYIFIPKIMQKQCQLNNFKLVTLTSKNDKRELTTVSVVPFYAKTGAKTEGMIFEKLTDELAKVTPAKEMAAGHYGIFYDYAGGVPVKLYDFDIK